MTSPKERAAEIDRLMALADDWVVAAIHAAISANSGWPTEAKPEKASATLRAALEAALDLGEPVAWMSPGYPQLITDEYKRENIDVYPWIKDYTKALYAAKDSK